MISSEVESLARTGGLGDVVDALSLAIAELGDEVLVVTPLYGVTRLPKVTHRWPGAVPTRFGWGPDDVRNVGVVELEPSRFPSGGGRRVCLVDDPGLFARAGIYADANGTFGDNALRFAVMSRAGLEIADRVWPDRGPDILHAHDWHAAFAVLYARLVMGDRWKATPSIFTIHNLAYQGVLDEGSLDRFHLPREAWNPHVLWHEDRVNLLKGATALADRITTVSPTYAKEILTPENGFGLDGHLRAHAARVRGIVNGIDVVRFDPATDAALAARYDQATFAEGRAACREALIREAGLDPSATGPIFGAVTRLTWQKGIDLLLPVFGEIVESGGSIVVVGQGEAELEAQLLDAMDHHPGRVCVKIAFDPPLSRRIYAGADFFLMPSRFEPCGLTQMYAMRYGSIPIVTDVGGLHDTVAPIAGDAGTGFVAAYPGIDALRLACDSALDLYADAPAHARAIVRAMNEDFSWGAPAREYGSLFDEVMMGK